MGNSHWFWRSHFGDSSGQIIATSHDLTPNGGLVKYCNLARFLDSSLEGFPSTKSRFRPWSLISWHRPGFLRNVGRANVGFYSLHRCSVDTTLLHVYIYILMYIHEKKKYQRYTTFLPHVHAYCQGIILQCLHSSSSYIKRFIAEGCAVGFCCGCYRYGHELLDGRADLGTVDCRQFGFSSCWVSYVGCEEFSSSLISWLVNHRCLSKFLFDQWGLSIHCAKEGGGERNTKWFLFMFFSLWYEYVILWQETTVKDAIPSSFFHQLPSIFGTFLTRNRKSNRLIPMFLIGISRFPSLWKALADTFDPSIPRPSALEPYNPAPFFAEAPLVQEIGWVLKGRCNGNRKTTSWTASFFRGFYDTKTCVMIFNVLFWIQNALRVVGSSMFFFKYEH